MEFLVLLAPLAAALFAGAFDNNNDDDVEPPIVDPEPEPEPEPSFIIGTDGDDQISATGSETSVLDFDTIFDSELVDITNTETGDSIDQDQIVAYDQIGADTLPGLTYVNGGDGDDTITVTGLDLLVSGGEGRDLIDLTNAGNVAVYGGEGDTILGAESGDASYQLSRGASFIGTNADDALTAFGASNIQGNGGNDDLRTTGGETTLAGGDGNDTLDGAFSMDEYASTNNVYRLLDGYGTDTLDGGAGDDLILFDHADQVTGGVGADRFIGELTVGETATITDFDARTETISLTVDGVDVTAETNDVQVVEENGDTLLQDENGATFLRIEGATGLNIAYQNYDGSGGGYSENYVDADGNPIEPGNANIILKGFYRIVN